MPSLFLGPSCTAGHYTQVPGINVETEKVVERDNSAVLTILDRLHDGVRNKQRSMSVNMSNFQCLSYSLILKT